MFFTRDNETLYPTTSGYNLALILEELTKIIINNGGKVQPSKRGQIINRSFYREADEERRRADHCRSYAKICGDAEKAARLEARAQEHEATAAELEKKAEDSRKDAEHLTYIIFTYDGFYYSLFAGDYNDRFTYHKTAINNNNEYSRDTYADDLSGEWWTDHFYALEPKTGINEDRREAANIIFNELTNAAPSEKYREGIKTRVPNTYNNGYHYETIYRPERMSKIDF